MQTLLNKLIEFGTSFGAKIVAAIVVFVVGCIIIKLVKNAMAKKEKAAKIDKTVYAVLKSIVSVALYCFLIIIVIDILGVPMSSIVAVLASCGLAIGLALQGALSNFAGGIMIIIFKPFKVGDYISAAGGEGTVKDISVFYTVLDTADNKKVVIPNGSLMNSNVTNFSGEPTRRIDVEFKVSNGCSVDAVKKILADAAKNTDNVLENPAASAMVQRVEENAIIFNVRVWCKNADYWDAFYGVTENCTKALAANNIEDPEKHMAVRMVKD